MRTSIEYIGLVLDRLERLAWPQWKIEMAYQELLYRRQRARFADLSPDAEAAHERRQLGSYGP